MNLPATGSRKAELRASEQMRDRIADKPHAEAMMRLPDASGGRAHRAFLHFERFVLAMPGSLAE